MKSQVIYLALVIFMLASLALSRPTGSKDTQRQADLDENEDEEYGELVLESEVDKVFTDDCLIFENPIPIPF